jgi:multiple sugar transport system ATP-binding protein
MPQIVLEHVSKRWNGFYAVDDLSLVMEDNSFITLLGPSGCGKTTTLRMIAGLETPTSGKITIGDQVVFDSKQGINVPAAKRHVGFLFQNYALWPNMTVYQNIVFGLKNISDEMPLYDEEYLRNRHLAVSFGRYNEIVKCVNDTREKKQINKDRALSHLIDLLDITIKEAKIVFDAHLENEANPAEKAGQLVKDYTDKAEAEKTKIKANKGLDITEKGELSKDNQVITKNRRLTGEELDLTVRRASRIVKIGDFMDRYPSELSGGQQQRVAIARTLAPKPTVLFMDEPLSNLDAKLRLEMRAELQRLHADLGATFVYVTHDQLEAMTLATKICLINNGVLQQYDAPLDVYKKPNNLFVADFVGNPSINFVEAKGKQNADGSFDLSILDGKETIHFKPSKKLDAAKWHEDERALEKSHEEAATARGEEKGFVEKSNKDSAFRYHIAKVEEKAIQEEYVPTDEDYILAIRPEAIHIAEKGHLRGTIYSSMPTGMETTVRVNADGFLLTGVIFGGLLFKLDQEVEITLEGDGIMLFDRKSQKFITLGSVI